MNRNMSSVLKGVAFLSGVTTVIIGGCAMVDRLSSSKGGTGTPAPTFSSTSLPLASTASSTPLAPTATQPPHTVVVVTDDESGEAIEGARITLGGKDLLTPAYTDDTGRYELDLPGINGPVGIWVNKKGYSLKKRTVNPTKNLDKEVEIRLEPLPTSTPRPTSRPISSTPTASNPNQIIIGTFKSITGNRKLVFKADGTYRQYIDGSITSSGTFSVGPDPLRGRGQVATLSVGGLWVRIDGKDNIAYEFISYERVK